MSSRQNAKKEEEIEGLKARRVGGVRTKNHRARPYDEDSKGTTARTPVAEALGGTAVQTVEPSESDKRLTSVTARASKATPAQVGTKAQPATYFPPSKATSVNQIRQEKEIVRRSLRHEKGGAIQNVKGVNKLQRNF